MNWRTFHVITSPIRAIKLLGFPNTTRSDRHDFAYLPYDQEPHTNIKSTRILKYTVKRSF
ncbi:uncharacterized protein G2W53_040307 [Senna tora]|uniref:Uncharacterized protein n=1 Tax=Senna tora TaxID=362788 RepID=A0A834W6Z0_9FABA|nr:uncharacterized protein G2W53_040307 [Senna tora]